MRVPSWNAVIIIQLWKLKNNNKFKSLIFNPFNPTAPYSAAKGLFQDITSTPKWSSMSPEDKAEIALLHLCWEKYIKNIHLVVKLSKEFREAQRLNTWQIQHGKPKTVSLIKI